jgi:cyanate permease
MLAGAAGVWMMGAGYDRYHSYTVPLAVLCGAMVLALVLLSRLGPYRFAPEAVTGAQVNPLEVPTRA